MRREGSIDALFHDARSADEEQRWSIVTELQRRGTEEVFAAAAAACGSAEPAERLLGVDVLGQLGFPDRPFRDRTLPLLVTRLDDADPDVAAAAGIALGHQRAPEAVDALAAKAAHPNADVRLGVVHGLSGLDDDRAVDALVALSRDPDTAVRDWATFSLGSQLDRDTPQVRDALRDRLLDPDPDTRAEAVEGLARRGA